MTILQRMVLFLSLLLPLSACQQSATDWDPGQASRKEYKRSSHYKGSKDYALHGDPAYNNKSKRRTHWARMAAHYQGPLNGYYDKGNKYKKIKKGQPKPGRARYATRPPVSDREVVINVYRWVRDLLWPKTENFSSGRYVDVQIFDALDRGWLDVGEPWNFKHNVSRIKTVHSKEARRLRNKTAFICIEHAFLLSSLLRELGYPVQEKNITYGTSQTAAVNVWYGGQWNLLDPFMSRPGLDITTLFDYKVLLNGQSYQVHEAERAGLSWMQGQTLNWTFFPQTNWSKKSKVFIQKKKTPQPPAPADENT